VLTGLSYATTYHFRINSKDSSGNDVQSVDQNFLTANDTVFPEISNISVSVISSSQAVVTWETDEAATSRVTYGTQSGNLTNSTSIITPTRNYHTVILTELTADQKYYFKVKSKDAAENETISAESNFTTLSDPEFDHDPLSEITDITESIITDEAAAITFNTDQEAQCYVESGTQSGNYGGVSVAESGYNSNHSIHLSGLIFSTEYFYKVTCLDNLDTTVSSSEKNFTTLSDGSGAGDDSTAPEISGVNVGTITGESVTVTWDTNEEANSLIKFGITSDVYEGMAGDPIVNSDVTEYATTHTVIINNLTPATKYYYAVISTDPSGNISESTQDTFTTKSPSSLSSINIESKSLNEVTVTWKTSMKASSLIEYGLTESYGDKKENTSLTEEHAMTLTGLTSNTLYHFRVKGKDADNNWYSSGDYTLEDRKSVV
jgi:hypothetical protein